MKTDRFTVPISIVLAGGLPVAVTVLKMKMISSALLALGICVFIAVAYRKSRNPLLVCCGAVAFEHLHWCAWGIVCRCGQLPWIGRQLVINYALAVIVIAFLCYRHACVAAGFNSPRRWSSIYLIVLPIFVIVLGRFLIPTVQNWYHGRSFVFIRIKGSLFVSRHFLVTAIAGCSIFAAVAEEGLYRGVVLNALRGYSAKWSMVISSIFFGIFHLTYYSHGAGAGIVMAIVYTLFGICCAALRMVTGTIWAPIMVHAFNNFLAYSGRTDSMLLIGQRYQTSFYGGVYSIASFIPLAFYGFWILRRMRASKCRASRVNRQAL